MAVAMIAFALAFVAEPAHAAVEVPTPDGWDGDVAVGPEARQVADSWVAALEGDLVSVSSTRGEDDHLELIVAIRLARPIPPRVLRDRARVLEELRQTAMPLFDARGEPVETETLVVDGVTGIRARWAVDDLTWDAVMLPESTSRVLVVMRAPSSELVFYDSTFDRTVAELRGAEPPVKPIDRTRWRVVGGIIVVVIGGLLFGVMLGTSDVSGFSGAEAAGRRAAVFQLGVTVVGTLVVFVFLAGKADALAAAGTSAVAVVGELALGGMLVSALLVGLGRLLDSGPVRIKSAPDVGTFRQGHPGLHDSIDEAAVPQQVEDLPPR